MRSPSTLLPASPKLRFWQNEKGFSLLEVVVALAILAGGFLVVLNLFSGSVRSVDFSGQYLKGVTLANSKINELEMLNFEPDELSGNFKNEESYRWEVDITPYDSPLNDSKLGIQLQKILLKVLWEDQGQNRNVELATLHLKRQSYPVSDTSLELLFTGGSSPASSGEEEASSSEESGSTSANVSGGSTTTTTNTTSCPSGTTFIFGAGCQ
ncbi:MAG: prepilin-type N-terminal cleavage/methylation domain-containing protein [Nitrospina sp.]|mgnify:FL=1|jgi:general secretion pathway protein I|nr:prepilin-type N-terminal cleavage/methylation domain-containing protein [Nitrospina sp.]